MTYCDRCGKPKATDEDYETIPEGEGDHLCWGAYGGWSSQCSMTDGEVVERLRGVMREVANTLQIMAQNADKAGIGKDWGRSMRGEAIRLEQGR